MLLQLPFFLFHSQSVYERVEAIDMSDDEATLVLEQNPRHVHRWLEMCDQGDSLLVPPPTSATAAVASFDVNPVDADIAVGPEVEPRPSTSGVTSKSKPAPRRLVDYGSDFDTDYDDEFDGNITDIVGNERAIPSDDELDEPTQNVINDIEHGMDDAVDNLLGISTEFTWEESYESFRGKPEEFSGPAPGPIRDYDSAYDAFVDIWDKTIIDRIVLETNRYAKETTDALKEKGVLKGKSRIHQWTETNADEILLLFGVFMLMAIDSRTSLHEYWKGGPLAMANFRSILSHNRYSLLNKFLHFVPNDGTGSVNSVMSHKLRKLEPILVHLQEKFSTLYNLGRNISIDESLTLFKGRLSWIQAIRSKAARFGIKSYELCESSTGYMSKFQIYTGKSDTFVNTEVSLGADLGGKTTKVVLNLLQGLDRRGHNVTMDNFYNSPSLARYLKSQGFDCLGTLRVTRRNVPADITKVSKNVPKGTIIARHSGDVSLVSWKDTKVVTIISTYHDAETYVGSKAGKTLVKPVCIRDYNNTMGGIDLKDQKLSMYLLERKRGLKWYIKLFKRLLNVSIHNAFVMYVRSLRRRNLPALSHREFRYQLAEAIISKHRSSEVEALADPASKLTRLRRDILHRPRNIKGATNRRRCVMCYRRTKKQKLINSFCDTCDVFLCLEADCWDTWHTSTEDLESRQRKRGRKRKLNE